MIKQPVIREIPESYSLKVEQEMIKCRSCSGQALLRIMIWCNIIRFAEENQLIMMSFGLPAWNFDSTETHTEQGEQSFRCVGLWTWQLILQTWRLICTWWLLLRTWRLILWNSDADGRGSDSTYCWHNCVQHSKASSYILRHVQGTIVATKQQPQHCFRSGGFDTFWGTLWKVWHI